MEGGPGGRARAGIQRYLASQSFLSTTTLSGLVGVSVSAVSPTLPAMGDFLPGSAFWICSAPFPSLGAGRSLSIHSLSHSSVPDTAQGAQGPARSKWMLPAKVREWGLPGHMGRGEPREGNAWEEGGVRT